MTATVEGTRREVLLSPTATLSATMQAVEELERANSDARASTIGVSSNVTLSLLGTFLRKHALLAGARLRVTPGNFDDVLGDLERFQHGGVQDVLILPFFDNLVPSFEAQLPNLSAEAIEAKLEDVRARHALALERARGFRTVFLCTFHRFGASADATAELVSRTIGRFNEALRQVAASFPNVRIIDTVAVVAAVGAGRAFDRRFYYKGKAPYSAAFLDELARRVGAASRGFGGHFYKALVIDCDNTLWGGVIGEDQLAGIQLGPHDYPGNVYWRVQNEIVALERSGVLLVLCSKNNPEDVDEVFAKHPDCVLKPSHIILKKVNWQDKATNLREISAELNIGLDSLVFLDDSDFECSGVRAQLPMVRTFQVPSTLSEYPRVFEEIKELFLAGAVSGESASKTEQYRQRAEAETLKASFGSQEEFLASLGLEIDIARDARASIPRISELTQKSNQFNVTTRRYGVGEITQLMDAASSTVYSVVVRDKFGSAGLTGIIIMRWEGRRAVVDSFLMSCRVIGRGIEFAVWNDVIADARARGCSEFVAQYVPTRKNALVKDFFDRLGLPATVDGDGTQHYAMAVADFPAQSTPWIKVTRGE